MAEKEILERIARALDYNNSLLERLIRIQGGDDHCPACGSADLEDTSTMGHPSLTCQNCRQTFEAEPEGH